MTSRMQLLIRMLVTIFSLIAASSPASASEDLVLLNRPVNMQGLSGLLFTTAPYTLPSGTMEFGISAIASTSHQPEYRVLEYPASISFGLAHNTEISLKGSFGDIKDSSSGVAQTVHVTGDVVLALKWNFIPQQEDSAAPAFALIASATMPASRNPDTRINSVSRDGFRFGVSAGSEFAWHDHILDVYADGSVVSEDPTYKYHHDLYWAFNAGILFPISKYRNLQTLLEYSEVGAKDRTSFVTEGNYSAMTYGLRLVNERFNITIGTQLLRNQGQGYGKSEKTIGLMSIKF